MIQTNQLYFNLNNLQIMNFTNHLLHNYLLTNFIIN